MSKATDAVGGYGERVAARALQAAGMQVIDRNWRCSAGELDIIARDATGTIVFCEVKTRRSESAGAPADAVNPAKVGRLRQLAALWLAAHPQVRGEVRFDVISVRPGRRGAAALEHLRGAF
jgi:putative endonuclease